MKNLISLDFNYLMTDILGTDSGIDRAQFDALETRAREVERRIKSEREGGGLAFLDIDRLKRHLPAVKAAAGVVRERFDKLVVLGIGGSALGTRAIQEALVNPLMGSRCEVIVADNIDPLSMARLIDSLDLSTTAFNVISKSGGTVETLAQFMVITDLLRKKVGDAAYHSHLVFTTDPKKGVLREIASEEGITALEVDPEIGGRFSVLTPVGLFPAEIMGVDSSRLLNGAHDFVSSVEKKGWRENPAYLYGALMYIAATSEKRNISVMMPYSGRLFSFALWYCQLWAESLGKWDPASPGGKNGLGQTPVAAVGVTDQHSQLQLFMEGPRDKVITFVRVEDHGADVTIPRIYEGRESLDYLGMKRIGELFDAERSATEAALARQGRPSMTVSVPDISPEGLGVLFSFFQAATAFAGYLYGIDPFDQPGVEEGKKYTWGIMGRTGYEEKLQEYHNRPRKLPVYTKSADTTGDRGGPDGGFGKDSA
jgi:glucose-6-phosphate isomerase